MSDEDIPFKSLNIIVITVSDTRTVATDKAGQYLSEQIEKAAHHMLDKQIVKDDVYQIRALVSNAIIQPETDVVLLTGGTGVTGRDGTPEAVCALFDKTLDGFGEMFRQLSWEQIKTSTMQSRAVAGVANGTYIFSLPGSPAACKLAWEQLLSKQLDIRTRPCNLAELLPRLKET